jgi:uncharacterized membrane protein YfcA
LSVDAALLAALAIVLAAGVISGLTGFGFALVSVPVLLLVYDPATVVTLSLTLTLVTCTVIAVGVRHAIDLPVVLAMLPGAVAGLLTGAWLLTWLDAALIKVIAGSVVVVFSLVLLRGVHVPGAGHLGAAILAGAASGTLATSTGLSGPPAVMLLAARNFTRDPFRASISAYFVAIDVIGIGALIWQGVLTERQLSTTAVLLPAAVLGTYGGARLSRRVNARLFRRLTLSLLLLTGLLGAVTAAIALV